MRAGWLGLLMLACWPGGASAQPVLDAKAVPYLNDAGRQIYAGFTQANLPRAAAIAPSGQIGLSVAAKSLDAARADAVGSCTASGGKDCRAYAENLDVVWPGRETHAPPPPDALVSRINYAFVPDPRYFWHGPAAAAGVLVWSHGKAGRDVDLRGLQPQPWVRLFNNAGFDIVRFDRAPLVDEADRAAGWLEDELPVLRQSGYRRIVAAGQSRGAWSSLQMLGTSGLADVVIAISPAAHGQGASTNLLSQDDDFRRIMAGAPGSSTRVALVQFARDAFIGDPDVRVRLLERLQPKAGALLLIDRPDGFIGHGAANGAGFANRFGACLVHFATDAVPPVSC